MNMRYKQIRMREIIDQTKWTFNIGYPRTSGKTTTADGECLGFGEYQCQLNSCEKKNEKLSRRINEFQCVLSSYSL